MKGKAKIFVYGPNYCVINGLERMVAIEMGFSVCGKSENAGSIISKIRDNYPSALVVEPSTGCNANLGLIRKVRRRYKDLPVLVVSQLPEQTYAPHCIYYGATGYVPMDSSSDEVKKALLQVLKGKIYLSNHSLKDEAERLNKIGFVDPTSILTSRQIEIYKLIGSGYTDRSIANELLVSVRTVETQIYKMKKELGYTDSHQFRRDAILWAHGVIIDIANKKD